MEYKKLLTRMNVAIAVVVIGGIICVSAVLFHRPASLFDRTLVDLLELQLKELQKQHEQLQGVATEQARRVEEDRRHDSLQQLQYERLVSRNREILNQLTQLRNERIDRINDPRFGADSIRRAFAE